ncbi:hypothetical protein CPC08DRAFT_466528 [Agrocybe pediades]|nr:hypothetical protein CPC08DRAFT_466528 [Agrocybe pediades]
MFISQLLLHPLAYSSRLIAIDRTRRHREVGGGSDKEKPSELNVKRHLKAELRRCRSSRAPAHTHIKVTPIYKLLRIKCYGAGIIKSIRSFCAGATFHGVSISAHTPKSLRRSRLCNTSLWHLLLTAV